jgi:hypothetical protein
VEARFATFFAEYEFFVRVAARERSRRASPHLAYRNTIAINNLTTRRYLLLL